MRKKKMERKKKKRNIARYGSKNGCRRKESVREKKIQYKLKSSTVVVNTQRIEIRKRKNTERKRGREKRRTRHENVNEKAKLKAER